MYFYTYLFVYINYYIYVCLIILKYKKMKDLFKFRAKTLHGKKDYVYGSLTKSYDGYYITSVDGTSTSDVDGETVGLFIGIKDSKGREIYTKDKVIIDGTKGYENCIPAPKESEFIGVFEIDIILGNWGYEIEWNHLSGYGCSTHIMGDMTDDCIMPNVTII